MAELYAAYEDRLVRRGLLDLDDVLLRAADLLRDDPAAAELAHWRYRHVAVDEFQDVNPAQFRLIEALLGARVDLCAVGDPNQAIYGWNGADPGLLASLPERVVGLEVIHLDHNHRCTPQVVAAAVAALGSVAVAPPRSAVSDGPMPTVTAFEDDRAEAEAVAARILERAESGMRLVRPGRAGPHPRPPRRSPAGAGRGRDPLSDRAGLRSRSRPRRRRRRAGAAAARLSSSGRKDPGGGVELATFHRAKGLEWEAVSVVGLEQGFVPIVHAVDSGAVAEERRLLYVALTRAARVLECSWARSRALGGGRPMERRPSPWLAGLSGAAVEGTARRAPGRPPSGSPSCGPT